MNHSIHSEKAKNLILEALLRHVPFDGWTLSSLKMAVKEAGFKEGDEYRAFDGDMDQVLVYAFEWFDHKMEEKLKKIDLKAMRTKDRVATCIMVRLHLMAPYKMAIQKSFSYLAKPSKALLGAKCVAKTVNKIWYAAGDKATDFNYYTKRALLMGVYVSTVRFWLQDQTGDDFATRAYLERRLADAMKIPQLKATLQQGLDFLCRPFRR